MSQMTVAADDFASALDQVLRTASDDRKLPILQCVLIEANDTFLRLVATDKTRLAVRDLAALDNEGASFRVLVLAADLERARPETRGGSVSFSVATDSLAIAAADREHTLPLVVGDYPNYQAFLVADAGVHTIITDRSALLAAIEDQSDDQIVRFRCTTDGLEVGGPTSVRVPVEYAGPEISFVLNPDYAHDAVGSASGTLVAIDAAGPVSPVVFRSVDDDSFTAVVMPIRISEPRSRRRP